MRIPKAVRFGRPFPNWAHLSERKCMISTLFAHLHWLTFAKPIQRGDFWHRLIYMHRCVSPRKQNLTNNRVVACEMSNRLREKIARHQMTRKDCLGRRRRRRFACIFVIWVLVQRTDAANKRTNLISASGSPINQWPRRIRLWSMFFFLDLLANMSVCIGQLGCSSMIGAHKSVPIAASNCVGL